jgi:hypothetical protein
MKKDILLNGVIRQAHHELANAAQSKFFSP